MDRWDYNKSLREDHHHRHRRENPSFSSTLLDAIYNSIDDQSHNKAKEDQLIFYKETTMRSKKHTSLPNTNLRKAQPQEDQDEEMASFRKTCMIEKWMEKKNKKNKVNEKEKVLLSQNENRAFMLQNSSSSSSDSSCGGGFSSSESDSMYVSNKSRSSSSSCYNIMQQRPATIRPIRTSLSEKPRQFGESFVSSNYNSCSTQNSKPKHENGFVKTKSKAMKIYGDLKKVKQPISPGGKLATFLNSLFTNASKKAKTVGGFDKYERSKPKSTTTSTCSSASSFSRSCLSKTPSSSRGKFSNNNGSVGGGVGVGNVKRSVRFCPVSVIVDEDCRPCGHKSLHEAEPAGLMAVSTITDAEIKCYVMGGNYRVEEVAKDLFKNYQKEKEMRDCVIQDANIGDFDEEEEEEDDDDDAASYSSSDLFELDNLSAIGIERYREELPVYETTHFSTNRAIANGLIL